MLRAVSQHTGLVISNNYYCLVHMTQPPGLQCQTYFLPGHTGNGTWPLGITAKVSQVSLVTKSSQVLLTNTSGVQPAVQDRYYTCHVMHDPGQQAVLTS